jgi:hypothetical protein
MADDGVQPRLGESSMSPRTYVSAGDDPESGKAEEPPASSGRVSSPSTPARPLSGLLSAPQVGRHCQSMFDTAAYYVEEPEMGEHGKDNDNPQQGNSQDGQSTTVGGGNTGTRRKPKEGDE